MYSNLFGEHLYTLDATGIKFKGRSFTSRQVAKNEMYQFIDKHHLHVVEKYNDKHFVTYVCNDGVKFYINRV